MSTIGDLENYCKENKIKFTVTRNKTYGLIEKITVTKTRAIKIIINRGRLDYAMWDNRRGCYGKNDFKSWSYHRLADDLDLAQWYDAILELLETEPAEKEEAGFKIPQNKFSDKIFSRYTNGLVKIHVTIKQAFISSVVKVTNRGIIKEMQTKDDCQCWFLVDGRDKCLTNCNGKPIRLIYDGEEHYVIVEKTDKSYRISEDQISLSSLDKTTIDSALELFLNLKEKEQSG